MRINKFAVLLTLAVASALFFEVAPHAYEADQATRLVFLQPIQIPGQVLPAGTYLFKLGNSTDRNLVQIFDAQGTRLIATLVTVSAERPEPNGKTVVILADQGAERPEALVKWFFPGRNIGHEFVYSSQEEQQLARDRQQIIEGRPAAEAGE